LPRNARRSNRRTSPGAEFPAFRRDRSIEVHAEDDRDLTGLTPRDVRKVAVAAMEADHARFDEQFLVREAPRKAAAGVPTPVRMPTGVEVDRRDVGQDDAVRRLHYAVGSDDDDTVVRYLRQVIVRHETAATEQVGLERDGASEGGLEARDLDFQTE